MKTYADALAMLQTRKRKLARNTYLVDCEEYIAVKLHQTQIIKLYPNGDVQLSSGGWRTPTTKDRINKFSLIRVWQGKGVWYCSSTPTVRFADGITFHACGTVTGADSTDEKSTAKLRKRINAYAKTLVSKTLSGELGAPSGGDCWLCMLHDAKTGEAMDGGADHLLSHVEEDYYVPSLLANVIEPRTKTHMGVTYSAVSPIAHDAVVLAWQKREVPNFYRDIATRQLTAAVANYIFHAAGMVATRSR